MVHLRSAQSSEELLECLEGTANLLLRDVCQVVDLSECTRSTTLAASNEDAASDDSALGLPFKCLCIIDKLEEMLSVARGVGCDTNCIAEVANGLVIFQQVLIGLVLTGFVLGTVQRTTTAARITESDGRGELGSVEKVIGTVSNTGRIVVALVIV